MNKRVGSILWLIVTAMLLLGCGSAWAEKDNGVWVYEISNGKAIILEYKGSEHDLQFPDTMEDCPVVQIGKGNRSILWYNDQKSLKLTFPETVEVLEGNYFTLGSIKKVRIPASVRSIGQSTFEIFFSDVVFEGAPETLGDYAFQSSCLKKMIVNEGTASIGERCFEDCSALKTVSLPMSLEYLGSEAFRNCTKLSNLSFAENSALKAIPKACFVDCHALKTLTLPDHLESIDTNAFYGCKKLTSVVVPSTVTKIADDAFAACSPKLTFTVAEGSYAEQWAIDHEFKTKTDSTLAGS